MQDIDWVKRKFPDFQYPYWKEESEILKNLEKMDVNYQGQLEMIPIHEVEKFLRKKKLENLKRHE